MSRRGVAAGGVKGGEDWRGGGGATPKVRSWKLGWPSKKQSKNNSRPRRRRGVGGGGQEEYNKAAPKQVGALPYQLDIKR